MSGAPQTALAAAMERAGLKPIHHRLRGLIFQMHAEGIGEDEFDRVAAQAWADVRAKHRAQDFTAGGLPVDRGGARGGQTSTAQQGQLPSAPAQNFGGEARKSLPSDGPGGPFGVCLLAGTGSASREGHTPGAADGGRINDAPRDTTADGMGHAQLAANQQPVPHCPPVRTPSPAAAPPPSLRPRRDFAAIMAAQPTIARGYLDSRITSDGRKWGDVGWHELDGMNRDGAVARALKQAVARPLKQTTPLRELISNARFQELYDAAMQAISV